MFTRWGIGFATLAAVVVAAVFAAVPAHAAIATDQLGVYRGGGKTAAVASYEDWLGRKMGWVQDNLPRDSWSAIEDPGWILDAWRGRGYRLSLSVPTWPSSGGSLAECASGAYAAHFKVLAQNLVAGGFPGASLRIAPEFNGDWFAWSAGGKEAQFVGCWRSIVDAMRSVPGQSFTFDWNPNMGSQKADVEAAYPGDAYVDYIGLDAYDQDWNPGWDVATTRWTNIMNMKYGLAWHRAFAAAHHKPMTFPEWGAYIRPDGHGGGDDPYYIQQMYNWIGANDVAYAVYFEFDAPDGQHKLTGTQFPNAAAAFRQLFGPAAVAPAPAPVAPAPVPVPVAPAPVPVAPAPVPVAPAPVPVAPAPAPVAPAPAPAPAPATPAPAPVPTATTPPAKAKKPVKRQTTRRTVAAQKAAKKLARARAARLHVRR